MSKHFSNKESPLDPKTLKESGQQLSDPNKEVVQVLPADLDMETLNVHIQEINHSVIHGGMGPGIRPQRTVLDVWTRLTEYREGGGILDVSEDIAELSQVLLQLHSDKDLQGSLSGKELVEATIKAAQARARMKQTHQEMQVRRKEFMTLDSFHIFLSRLGEILHKYIQDPQQMKQLGAELQKLVQILQEQGS